jgi:hypothetical protein
MCLMAALVAVTAAPAHADSYLGSGKGTAPSVVGGGGGGGSVDVWDLRNLTYGPKWGTIARGSILTNNGYCGFDKPGIIAPNGYAFGDQGQNARKRCANRLSAWAINGTRKGTRAYLTAQQLCKNNAAAAKAYNICWYSKKGTFNSDAQLHQRLDQIGPSLEYLTKQGTLALNFVVWRYDTISPGKRSALRGNTVDYTSGVPIFQRRLAVFPDGGNNVAKAAKGADEGACANPICWGNLENTPNSFPNNDRASRRSWWYGGAANSTRNAPDAEVLFGSAAGNDRTTWDNPTTKGGPLGSTGSGDCYNQSLEGGLQGRPLSYFKANATATAKAKRMVWPNAWNFWQYVSENKLKAGSGFHACLMSTKAPHFKPYYGVEYKADGKWVGGRVDYAATQPETIALAWNMQPGQQPRLFYRIEGVPGALYVVQIYGVTSREQINTAQVDAFLGAGGVGGEPGDPGPCVPGSALCPGGGGDEGEDGDPTVISDPPTGMPEDGIGSPFPAAIASLDAPKRVIRTGDVAPWNVTISPDQDIDDGSVLFLRGSLFRIGEPQIDHPTWGRTVDGQPFFNPASPDTSRFGISLNGQRVPITADNFETVATWPFTDSFTRAGSQLQIPPVMSITSAVSQSAPNSLFSASDTLWNGQFQTSTLIPSQNEDAPQLAQAGSWFESGRWYERTRPIPATSCAAVARYGRPGGDSRLINTGSVGEGYYYHNANDECNDGLVDFWFRVQGDTIPAGTRVKIMTRERDDAGNPARVLADVAIPNAVASADTANPRVGGVRIMSTNRGGCTTVTNSSTCTAEEIAAGHGTHVREFRVRVAMPVSDSDEDDAAYQPVIEFPSSGYYWQMWSTRTSDPGDKIQWAGHDTFAEFGLPGTLGPDYDPATGVLGPPTSYTCMPDCRAFEQLENGAFAYASLLTVGNQPTH